MWPLFVICGRKMLWTDIEGKSLCRQARFQSYCCRHIRWSKQTSFNLKKNHKINPYVVNRKLACYKIWKFLFTIKNRKEVIISDLPKPLLHYGKHCWYLYLYASSFSVVIPQTRSAVVFPRRSIFLGALCSGIYSHIPRWLVTTFFS